MRGLRRRARRLYRTRKARVKRRAPVLVDISIAIAELLCRSFCTLVQRQQPSEFIQHRIENRNSCERRSAFVEYRLGSTFSEDPWTTKSITDHENDEIQLLPVGELLCRLVKITRRCVNRWRQFFLGKATVEISKTTVVNPNVPVREDPYARALDSVVGLCDAPRIYQFRGIQVCFE